MTEVKDFLDTLTPISDETWAKISVLLKPRLLKKGVFFIEEGQVAKEIGFLYQGIIRGFYRNADGFEYNKHFFTNPSFVGGYASLITNTPNQISQQALSDCQLWVANFEEFSRLYLSCPDLERAARILAERFFVQKEQREIELVVLDADQRYRLFQQQFPQLENQIAQYHIASYLGITPTQLSRIRRKLAQR